MKRALFLAVALGACRGGGGLPTPNVPTGGDPDRGKVLISAYHCGACHVVPGISGAQGVVAPPLTQFALRTYIGGEVPNIPANLVQWIRDPRQIEPKTAMPNLGLDESEARDVAAYLYTLR